jgi:hypothetical protein
MQLEIKTTIDAFNPIQVKALNDFLVAVGGTATALIHKDDSLGLAEAQVIADMSRKVQQTRKKAEKVEAPQEDISTESEAPQEETKPEAIEVVEPETVSAPTLMQIRSLVAQKAADHKDSIKSKLAELGAQNVSTLDAKHFQTIFDFLTEL